MDPIQLVLQTRSRKRIPTYMLGMAVSQVEPKPTTHVRKNFGTPFSNIGTGSDSLSASPCPREALGEVSYLPYLVIIAIWLLVIAEFRRT